MMQRESS